MLRWVVVPAAGLALFAGTSYAAPAKPQSAISQQCSQQANAKGLHGKARKAFREKCKRAALKKS